MREKHNGWSNYETWATALHLNNEESSQAYWLERAKYWKHSKSTSEYWTKAESAKFNLADELKESFTEANPLIEDVSVYSDLLRSALDNVDWNEIAANLLTHEA